jgi:DNA-binding beta-propeller fold protein YncE
MRLRLIVAIWGLVALTASAPAADLAPLELVADVPLSGAAVRFDYQNLDVASNRLYIAHMDADQLVVFDTKTRSVIATLAGFPRVHGVIIVPELNRVYASATGDHKVLAVDAETLKIIARAGPIHYPDGLAYAPGVKRVFVSDEHGNAEAVVDAITGALVKTIPLGGNAGNTVYDPGSGKILVAVSQKNELVMIDPASEAIIGRYSLPGIEGPHGVVLDVSARLAFVAGEGNNKLAVFDLSSMRVLGTYAVGRSPDVLAFDPGVKTLYVAAESGQVTVFQENEKNLVFKGKINMPHAHTVSVDPQTHLVYFPLQNLNGHPVLRIMTPAEHVQVMPQGKSDMKKSR